MAGRIELRDVLPEDLPVFFEHQRDPEARHMAAFGAEDPGDEGAYLARWRRILADFGIVKRTILKEGRVIGHLMAFERDGRPEVGYWIGREHWGQGLATEALAEFLASYPRRPLGARAVRDNLASIRVLEKCGFRLSGVERAYASGRGEDVEEVVMVLESS
jgi:RimJ/RimL family protein N-acetyltransferase